MKHKYIWLCMMVFAFLHINHPVCAMNIPMKNDEIRVILAENTNACELTINKGSFEVIDFSTQLNFGEAQQGEKWKIAPVGKRSLLLARNGHSLSKLTGSLIFLKPKNNTDLNIFAFQGKRYRGSLIIENIKGNLNVINIIDVEKYLYGIVGAEMGISAPDEALKAQSVVSRTYALYYKEYPQKINYDVGITTRWQVYGGYDMEILSGSRVKNAVDSTKGQVIYYENKLIQAFFHSNSGGCTENSENVWWAYIPYIRAVQAPEDKYALNFPFQSDGWPASTYQWEKYFLKEELQKQIKKYNKKTSKPIEVGEILDIQALHFSINPVSGEYLTKNTESQRVTELVIHGSYGFKSIFRDNIRKVFGLQSTLFDIFFDNSVVIKSAVKDIFTSRIEEHYAVGIDSQLSKINESRDFYYIQDTNGVKRMPKQYSKLIFQGKGYGHGLGMSQWGARGLAAKGYNYQEIIKHYYNKENFDGKLKISLYKGQ